MLEVVEVAVMEFGFQESEDRVPVIVFFTSLSRVGCKEITAGAVRSAWHRGWCHRASSPLAAG